eukprot:TRINITY_DN14140_c1_g5_i2.p1 TRINITY_DN14140_c1_g5~~TRINITY_DN14140_c1_g5_i2.p1  ORF type:complete len:288 (-),score=34.08 TRINITY_DN14140_c1_g5_i2:37-780(-)
METYELTQEDDTLALAFRLNAQRRRHRPENDSAFAAQRRAANLAVHVARYKVSSRRPFSHASDDDSCSVGLDSDACSGDEVMRSYSDGVLLGQGLNQCRITDDDSHLRDVPAKSRTWKLATAMWKRYRQARARVMPASDALEKESYKESGHYQKPVRHVSLIPRMIDSIVRRKGRAKHARETSDASFSSLLSADAPDEHVDNADQATFDDFGNDSMLFGKCLSEPVRSFPRFKAVIRKVRTSATSKA